LKSAIFVLEHPTGEQRKWQLQNQDYPAIVDKECVYFGTGLEIYGAGWLFTRPAPEFGMTEGDASFITQDQPDDHGLSLTQIIRWELWSV
jgi:hypothetical protein